MKRKKSNLDEQQEQTLLKIESRGFWLAFWGLLIALIVQLLILDNLDQILGEWILMMGLALYLVISCIRAGIWDRRLDMSRGTCVVLSLIAALCTGVFMFGYTFLHFRRPLGSFCAAAVSGFVVFVICLSALALAAQATKKRQQKLNAEPDDESFCA